jgi:hypothetical protein
MLLSAGDFAVYRAESNVFNLLVPRFRGMRSAADRRELLEIWLRTKLFRVSGLDAREISDKIMAECRGGGDFLRIVMEEVARKQGTGRWADCTPDHLLYMQEIKRQIPDALFIHIIRDGRDVALSYVKQGWSYPLPWDRDERLGVAGLYWEWVVRKGREQARGLGADYQEVRFEELIANPRQTLLRLGQFIEHDLDYERITQAAIGSVVEPNTAFKNEQRSPISRWKSDLSQAELATLERLVGGTLEELGYELSTKTSSRSDLARMRAAYRLYFEGKQFLKSRTPAGRWFVKHDLSWV